MDLQKSIADMDSKAADYTRAANALRALLEGAGGGDSTRTAATPLPSATGKSGRSAATAAGRKGKGGKRTMSPETRAKIAAAARARNAARKATAA